MSGINQSTANYTKLPKLEPSLLPSPFTSSSSSSSYIDLTERTPLNKSPFQIVSCCDQIKYTLRKFFIHGGSKSAIAFDVCIMILITISIVGAVLSSVDEIDAEIGRSLIHLEIAVTAIFTVEYLLRVWVVPDRLRYIFGFLGIVDVISIVPTYVELLVMAHGHHTGLDLLRVVRALRLFRVLGIVGNGRYGADAITVFTSITNLGRRIVVFTISTFVIVFVVGSLMYGVEGGKPGFHSIPAAIYWAIVTVTTVGYGDIVPVSPAGRTLAVFLMLLAYGVVATGVFDGHTQPPQPQNDAFFYEFFHQHQINNSQPTPTKRSILREDDHEYRQDAFEAEKRDDGGRKSLDVTITTCSSPDTRTHGSDPVHEEEELSSPSKDSKIQTTPIKDSTVLLTPRKSAFMLSPSRQQLVKQLLITPLTASFACVRCGATNHLQDSLFCRTCGAYLRDDRPSS